MSLHKPAKRDSISPRSGRQHKAWASPRSGRQHKAWGASPRIESQKHVRARGAGDSSRAFVGCRPLRGLVCFLYSLSWGWRPRLYAVARFAGSPTLYAVARSAGLAHALCCRPLRGARPRFMLSPAPRARPRFMLSLASRALLQITLRRHCLCKGGFGGFTLFGEETVSDTCEGGADDGRQPK